MIKACIFDLDGTLTSTVESIARPCNRTLEYFGLPALPVENYNFYAGDGMDNSLRRALRDAGDPEGKFYEEGHILCRKWFAEDPLYHVKPYDHMVEALHELKANGIRIAVLSNKPHESAIHVVETIFGKGLFDHIQGQTDRIPIKPDPKGAFQTMRALDVKAGECLYFGDTDTDMLTGHNAGIYTVGVAWGFRPRTELEEYHADRIIDSPSEIPNVVRDRNKE
ncbi:MAG: HAD family hydrolase [Eubacterium sp.]|nr:HAD family hydrolase [Eubacterium sp.]